MKKNIKEEVIAFIIGELVLIAIVVELALVLMYRVH